MYGVWGVRLLEMGYSKARKISFNKRVNKDARKLAPITRALSTMEFRRWASMGWKKQFIDEHLQKLNVPIFDRLMRAAHLFVDLAITDSSYESKEELLKSTAFIEGIIPLFNDWYWGKYGELAKNPTNRIYLGIITPYGHPVLVKIPATTSRVEMPNETAWLTFPDCLSENESIEDMAQTKIDLDKLPAEEMDRLSTEFREVVSMTRKIKKLPIWQTEYGGI